jgi:hypothetical protein
MSTHNLLEKCDREYRQSQNGEGDQEDKKSYRSLISENSSHSTENEINLGDQNIQLGTQERVN